VTLDERHALAEELLHELDAFSGQSLHALADALEAGGGPARLFGSAIRWSAISKAEGRPHIDFVTISCMSTALYTAGMGPDGEEFRERLAGADARFWRRVGEALEQVEAAEALELEGQPA
jgi:hypothetical protein